MALSIEIKSPDIKKQLGLFNNIDKIEKRHIVPAMASSVATVQSNVRPLVPVGVSGRLRRSIVTSVRSKRLGVQGKVFSSLTSEVYPATINFGRKAGSRMPPPAALERWVRLKLGVAPQNVKGVAFVVARSIARKGIKGKQFMKKGFEKSRPAINRFFQKAIDKITKDLSIGR